MLVYLNVRQRKVEGRLFKLLSLNLGSAFAGFIETDNFYRKVSPYILVDCSFQCAFECVIDDAFGSHDSNFLDWVINLGESFLNGFPREIRKIKINCAIKINSARIYCREKSVTHQ